MKPDVELSYYFDVYGICNSHNSELVIYQSGGVHTFYFFPKFIPRRPLTNKVSDVELSASIYSENMLIF